MMQDEQVDERGTNSGAQAASSGMRENVQYKKRYAAYEYGKGIFFRPNQAGAGTDHLPMHKV